MSASTENFAGSIASDVSNPPMTERLNVQELLPKGRARKTPTPVPPEPQQPTVSTPENRPPPTKSISTVEAVLRLAGYALSARALLLLALIAAFVLAVMAMATESLMRLYVLVAYCFLVVAPVVALEIRKR